MANNITVTGRLGRDAELKTVGNGTALLTFSVADDVGFGDKKTTNWWRVSVWGKQAEGRLAEFLKKGAQVAVFGEVSMREHEGKGYLELRATQVNLIGGKSEGSGGSSQQNYQAPATTHRAPNTEPNELDDDLPF